MRLALAIPVVAAVIAACVSTTTPPGPSAPSLPSATAPPTLTVRLADTLWRLVAIDGVATPGGSDVTLAFSGGRVSGEGPCNSFGGTVAIDETTGALRIGDLSSTKRACLDPARGALETTWFAALRTVSAASVDGAGRLLLTAGAHELALDQVAPAIASMSPARAADVPGPSAGDRDPLDLVGTTWLVQAIDGQTTLVGHEPSAEFLANRVHGSTGCNAYWAELELDPTSGRLRIGLLDLTERFCLVKGQPNRLDEKRFVEALPGVRRARFDEAGRLVLDGGVHEIVLFRSA